MYYPAGVAPPEKEPEPPEGEERPAAASDGPKIGPGGREIKLHRSASVDAAATQRAATMLSPPNRRAPPPKWTAVLAHAMRGRVVRDDLAAVFAWLGFKLGEGDLQFALDKLNEILRDGPARAAVTSMEAFLKCLWAAVFRVADTDASGCISRMELVHLVEVILLTPCPEDVVERVMREYDADGSGVIEEEEFGLLASATFIVPEATHKAPLVDASDRAWRPPDDGTLDVVFQCQPGAASADETGSDDGVAGLLRLLKGADSEQERTVIFDVATSQTELYLTGEQARSVFDAAHCERSAVEKVAMLLPQVASAADACSFLETTLSGKQRGQLRDRLGPAFERGGDGRPVPGVVGPAGPRELRQHRVRVGGQRRAEALVDHRDRERDALEVGPVVVGAAPRRDLEGDDGEGVDVGGAAVGLGLEDLRRHPLGRAAARGHRRRRRRRGASVPREADVAELDAVADVAEHVRRLDVAVEHGRPVRVEVRQTPRDAERDDAPPRRGPRRVRAERVPEAARGDVLRHDGVVRRAGLEGRAHEEAHVRVPEPRLGGKRARNSQRLLFPPLVSADFGTSGHPPERARSLDAFSRTRARGTLTLKRR